METNYNIEQGILKVVGQGDFVLEDNKQIFKDIIIQCLSENLSKAFLDLRNVSGQCLKFESFDLINLVTKLLKEATNNNDSEIAIVFCAHGNLIQDTSYLNKIADSHKVRFKATSEYDSALEWIHSV